jgi:choline dehydrogenase-like flavoprotein
MNDATNDAIIIGSGAGGAAAAYQMVRAGLRVLLLEKGAALPRDGTTLDVERVVRRGEFLSREAWVDGRGRMLVPEERFNIGGKTKWYGAALLRFGAHEFAADAAFACRGWPLQYGDLEPHYRQAETLLGVREFEIEPDLRRIIDRLTANGSSWQAAPIPMGLSGDLARHRQEAAHFDGFASVSGLKGDAEQSFLVPVRSDANLTLLCGAEVTALLGSPADPKRIVGVRLSDGREFFAPHVLLAAGAMHSPRLLQRYLDGAVLNQTLPSAAHIGRNLKLHVLTAMVAFGWRRRSDLIRKTALLTHRHHLHSSVQPLGFDAEVIATLLPRFLPRALARALSARAYGFFLQTEDGSDMRNVIRERAEAGQTTRVMDYDVRRVSAAAREHRRFARALKRGLLLAGMLGFTRRIGLVGTAHVCGTLICGADPTDSVVDPCGAVHGMHGLYVVDGSILPRSSRVNPSLTIYAWALRTATYIIQAARTGAHNAATVGQIS